MKLRYDAIKNKKKKDDILMLWIYFDVKSLLWFICACIDMICMGIHGFDIYVYE